MELCPGPLNGTWCPACESVLKVDPAGATIGLRPLLLLITIALCIKLRLYPTFTHLVISGEVNHIVSQSAILEAVLSPCVKSQNELEY